MGYTLIPSMPATRARQAAQHEAAEKDPPLGLLWNGVWYEQRSPDSWGISDKPLFGARP